MPRRRKHIGGLTLIPTTKGAGIRRPRLLGEKPPKKAAKRPHFLRETGMTKKIK